MPRPVRDLSFETLADAAAEARRLHEGGSEPAGQWSLAQSLDHLAGAMHASRETGIDVPVPWIARKLLAPVLWWRLNRTGRLPSGVRAPASMEPATDLDEAATLERFEAECRAVSEKPGGFHPHPFFGDLAAAQWKRFHCVHAAHHLGFLRPRGDSDPV